MVILKMVMAIEFMVREIENLLLHLCRRRFFSPHTVHRQNLPEGQSMTK